MIHALEVKLSRSEMEDAAAHFRLHHLGKVMDSMTTAWETNDEDPCSAALPASVESA